MKTIKLVKNAKSVRCLFNGRLGFKINLVTLLGLKKVLQRYSIIYLASHRKTHFHFVQGSSALDREGKFKLVSFLCLDDKIRKIALKSLMIGRGKEYYETMEETAGTKYEDLLKKCKIK